MKAKQQKLQSAIATAAQALGISGKDIAETVLQLRSELAAHAQQAQAARAQQQAAKRSKVLANSETVRKHYLAKGASESEAAARAAQYIKNNLQHK